MEHKTLLDVIYKAIETVGLALTILGPVLGTIVYLWYKQRQQLAENTKISQAAVDMSRAGLEVGKVAAVASADSLIVQHEQMGHADQARAAEAQKQQVQWIAAAVERDTRT